MNLVENVVAGLLVALFVWCARYVGTWWHRQGALLVTSAIYRMEHPMGNPLAKPDLLPGAHRQLNDKLHELHSRANYPSMRSLARVIGVSPTTLSDSMTKAKLPSKDTAVRLALAFAERIRWDADVDVDEQEDRIDRQIAMLWEQARNEAEPPDQDRVTEAVRETWDDCVSGFWQGRLGFHEVSQAMERATFVEAEVSPIGWINLFVTVYDMDTYFILDGQGDDYDGQAWLKEFSTAVSRRLGTMVDVALQMGEDFDWPEEYRIGAPSAGL